MSNNITIKLIESPEEMRLVEEIQRQVWYGSETEIVPLHLLITAIHNGGLVLGAFVEDKIAGFVFGFPGIENTPDGPRVKHCSHMMGIHPDHRNSGIGFMLKRAQWQMVRHQELDHITWTYDPLLSRNAHLNIAKLGAVCSTYRQSEYGDLRDGLNAGLPSDRFQVDWWINTRRVESRLGTDARPTLKMEHLSRAGIQPMYPLHFSTGGIPLPPKQVPSFDDRLLLAEIPADFLALKSADFPAARDWRFFTRELFETAFKNHYIVTDFVFDRYNDNPRGLYVLTHGESTLEQFE